MAAVSISLQGRPRKAKLVPVEGFRKREITRGAKHWLTSDAKVVTDGLACWTAPGHAGHDRQAIRMALFKWVTTSLGNIRSAITGTYRKLGPDHTGRYQLRTMIPRFLHSAARTQPIPSPALIAG